MNADPQCIFCKIARGEIPSAHVFSNENLVAFLFADGRSENLSEQPDVLDQGSVLRGFAFR